MIFPDEIKNDIVSFFQGKEINGTLIRNFYQKHQSTKEYLSLFLKQHPEYQTEGKILTCFLNGIELPLCSCGKPITYKNYIAGRTHCSISCGTNDSKTIEKRKTSLLKEYGEDNPSKITKFKEARKNTMKEKYGVEHSLQYEVFQKKRKETSLKNNNYSNFFQSEESKRKQFSKAYDRICSEWKSLVIPLFTKEEYIGQDISYLWQCQKCGDTFEQKIYMTCHSQIDSRLPRCLNCYPFLHGTSNLEKEVFDFLKEFYSGEIIQNDRKTFEPYELDLFLPEKKVAIEFDGLFWHKEENLGKFYHLSKTNLCEKNDIQLIHIFEDEWIDKKDIVQSRIKAILGFNDIRYYARKCEIKEISFKECCDFLNKNHLQGEDTSKIRLGLYFQQELIAVMTFGKPRFNKNCDIELIRYCSLKNSQVVGGAGKLLSYFEKNYSYKKLISYADRRYSNGKLYKALGFSLENISEPNYFWFKNKIKYSRYQCQKGKLKTILKENFNPDLSESENLVFNGFERIYDCGNFVFIKKI